MPGADTSTIRSCVFCGSTKDLSREHLWPEWVYGVLNPDRRDGTDNAGAVWRTDEKVIRTVPRLRTLRVKRVCTSCNNTWMSRIEDEAKPILTRPIQGDPTTLHQTETIAAATWAYKTSLIADLLSSRVAGPRTFAHLYEHRRPPNSVAIIMGCYGGNRFPLYAGSRSITFESQINDGPRTKRDAYLLTVGVGHVVFQVFGHHIHSAFDLHPTSWKGRTSVVIWPQRDGSVRWPPSEPLTDDTLLKFARSL